LKNEQSEEQMSRVDDILDFWFGGADRERSWFAPDAEFDRTCTANFIGDCRAAAAGELDAWKVDARSSLALTLLLDQLPRNIFRGTARALAADERARTVAHHALARGFDRELPPRQRAFLYMPLQHSENADDQLESVRLFRALAAENPDSAGYIAHAEEHCETIRRFGRFPHRNAVLGRESTAAEREFLDRKKPER
jgi:uncharacterized protein (DUF924 family)